MVVSLQSFLLQVANNYEITHPNFWKEQKLSNQARNQKQFHKCYPQSDYKTFVTRRSQQYAMLKGKNLKGKMNYTDTIN